MAEKTPQIPESVKSEIVDLLVSAFAQLPARLNEPTVINIEKLASSNQSFHDAITEYAAYYKSLTWEKLENCQLTVA